MHVGRYSGLVVVLGTAMVLMVGCGVLNTHHSSASSNNALTNQPAPKNKNTASSSSQNSTFPVANSLHFPAAVRIEISKQCKVPIALPSRFYLDSPLPHNQQLAITTDVSTSQYGLDIFERPKGSTTSQYAMANFIGDIESVTELGSFNIPSDFNLSRFTSHQPVTLPGNTDAVYYQNSKVNENAIFWTDHSWKYIADGMGAYEGETVEMADTISKYVSTHSMIVPGASQGYVQSFWAGNRPQF